MKNLEEVKEHLHVVGYNQLAIQKIEGFLMGYGMLNEEYDIEYLIGSRSFDDFYDWFNSDSQREISDEEFGYGDFLHLQSGIDVLVFSDVVNGSFVGLDGEKVARYRLTEQTRYCTEEEAENVNKKLDCAGLTYCDECGELLPVSRIEIKNHDGARMFCESLGKLVDIFSDINNDLLDSIERDCYKAVKNIVSNMRHREMRAEEYAMLTESLSALIQLGKFYE